MKFVLITLTIALTLLRSYTIPIESFKELFVHTDSASLKQVKVRGTMSQAGSYMANQIKFIECIDKKGNLVILTNSPSIEMRITYIFKEKEKRTVIYFDTVHLKDSLVVGCRSRFIPTIQAIIPLDDIIKVEVQDGRKGLYYLDE